MISETRINTTRRIGRSIFRLDGDIWRDCKKYKIKDNDIKYYHNELKSLGINTSHNVAAVIVLREQKKKMEKMGL